MNCYMSWVQMVSEPFFVSSSVSIGVQCISELEGWYLTICTWLLYSCFNMPPLPKLDASDSTMRNALG